MRFVPSKDFPFRRVSVRPKAWVPRWTFLGKWVRLVPAFAFPRFALLPPIVLPAALRSAFLPFLRTSRKPLRRGGSGWPLYDPFPVRRSSDHTGKLAGRAESHNRIQPVDKKDNGDKIRRRVKSEQKQSVAARQPLRRPDSALAARLQEALALRDIPVTHGARSRGERGTFFAGDYRCLIRAL
jgi:hypothetical protein